MRFILNNSRLDALRRQNEEWKQRPESREWYEAKAEGGENQPAPGAGAHWIANVHLEAKSIAAKALLIGLPICLWQISTDIETLAMFALLPVLVAIGL